MKTTSCILALLTIIIVMACNKDDAPETPKESPKPPTETPTNKAPAAFDLIDVADGSDGIDLLPAFSWKAAVDPDGEAVTYDLYLDTQEDPTTAIVHGLRETTFTMIDSLHRVTDYHWKIVAKDTKGASVSSAVNTFTTRTFNYPDEPVTDNASVLSSFSKRNGHSMLAFNNELWVIGGEDGTYKDDVCYSRDGKTWPRTAIPAGTFRFQPRAYHTTVVFDNKLWVIGGFDSDGNKRNDVWSSSDGTNWRRATVHAQFSPRFVHAAVVFQNKLWVIGGNDDDGSKNDVWSSSDGITWTQETISAGFSPRFNHKTVVFQDKLWVIGGSGGGNKRDVWSSIDGKNWTEVTSSAEFPHANGASAMVFDDKIVLLGAGNEADIWYSTNGKKWSVMSPTNIFPVFNNPQATVFQNKIWFNNSNSKGIWALD